MTLREALANSLNTVAVRLGLEVGPRTVVRTAQRLGIHSALQPNASIALGTSEVTPLELVAAYAAFANGGTGVVPHVIASVATADGKPLYRRKPVDLGRVVEPAIVATLNGMLRETLLTGTARKAEFTGWEAAGKTGTSQEFRDAWFVGYTGRLVAGVWLGNDDGTPTKKVTGGNLPTEIWARFMRKAHEGLQPVALPGGPFGAPFGGSSGGGSGIPSAFFGTPPEAARGQRAEARRPVPAPRGDPDARVPPSSEERGLLQRLFGG